MQHRTSRRHDFENCKLLETKGEKPDEQLARVSEEFCAIDFALRHELPKFHECATKLVKLLTERLLLAQVQWFSKWETIFQHYTGSREILGFADLMANFQHDFGTTESEIKRLGIFVSYPSPGRGSPAEMIPVALQLGAPPDDTNRQLINDDDTAFESSESPGPSRSIPHAVVNERENDPRSSKTKGNQLWSAVALHNFNLGTTQRGDLGEYHYMIYKAGQVCPMPKALY